MMIIVMMNDANNNKSKSISNYTTSIHNNFYRPTTFQFGLSGAFTGFWISFIEVRVKMSKTLLTL